MLKQISIENFKAFADEQKIPIKPITLVFGANSSGKSSIIHSLLYARESVRTGKLDFSHTELSGDSVDLGGFKNSVYGHDWMNRNLSLSFKYNTSLPISGIARRFGGSDDETYRVDLLSHIQQKESKSSRTPKVINSSIDVNGENLIDFELSGKGGDHRISHMNLKHPLVERSLASAQEAAISTRAVQSFSRQDLSGILGDLLKNVKIKYKGIIPVSHSNEPTYDEAKKVYEHYSLENTIVWFLPEILRDNILGVSRSLRGILNKMIYLGPLRTYPSRHFAFSSFQQDANWVSGGGQAWDILLKDKKLRDKVNKWLNDPERLDIPYQFEVRQLFPESDIESEILSLFDYQVDYDSNDMEDDDLGIPPDIMGEAPFVNLLIRYMKKHDLDYDYENFAVHIINALKSRKFSGLSELVLMDPRLNIPLSHRDVGVGISQVLPVLVEALFNRNKLLLIEEPDIHVHPGLQAKLGDLFIESALSNGNTLMLESHSEHLLLRLLRRLRERYTTSRDRALTPDDIGILFIEREKGKSVVRELEIDEKGNFIGDWPQNFFAERAQELF